MRPPSCRGSRAVRRASRGRHLNLSRQSRDGLDRKSSPILPSSADFAGYRECVARRRPVLATLAAIARRGRSVGIARPCQQSGNRGRSLPDRRRRSWDTEASLTVDPDETRRSAGQSPGDRATSGTAVLQSARSPVRGQCRCVRHRSSSQIVPCRVAAVRPEDCPHETSGPDTARPLAGRCSSWSSASARAAAADRRDRRAGATAPGRRGRSPRPRPRPHRGRRRPAEADGRGRPPGRRRVRAGRHDQADRAEPVPVRRDRPGGRDRLRPRLGDDRGQALPDRQRLGRRDLRLRRRRQARPLLRHRHAPAPRHGRRRARTGSTRTSAAASSGRDRGVGPGLRGLLPRDRRRRHRQRRRPGRLPLQLRPERPLPQQRRRHVHATSARPPGSTAPSWSSGGALPRLRQRRRPRPLRRQLRRVEATPRTTSSAATRRRTSGSTARPGSIRTVKHFLYRNNGDRTFTDVYDQVIVDPVAQDDPAAATTATASASSRPTSTATARSTSTSPTT